MEMFDPSQNIITFTDKAQNHFSEVVSENSAIGVRLRLEGGGCAGFAYKWDLISDIGEINLADYNQKFDTWQFWMDDISKRYLMGSVVDKKVLHFLITAPPLTITPLCSLPPVETRSRPRFWRGPPKSNRADVGWL